LFSRIFVSLGSYCLLRRLLIIILSLPLLGAFGWLYFRERALPDYGPAYREYAYVTNGKSNSVSVIDLRTFELAKTIAVGVSPTGIAANKKKNEIYAVNSGSSNVSVIDAEKNSVTATIGVQGKPYFIDVSEDGKHAYVANSASANVSVIDLEKHEVVGSVRVGSAPGLARVSPDGTTVVVSNRADNTVSLIDAKLLRVRTTLPVCDHPEDIAILPDSSKAFVACSGSSQVASIALNSGGGLGDHLLALLDVGRTPVNLTLKPDGGELMVCDFDSDSISIVETGNDEVGSSVVMGQQPAKGIVTRDNSRLYVSNFGSDSVAVYDIDLGRRIATLAVGSRPEGLALSQDENYILVLDTQAGDVTVIQRRTPRKLEPTEYSLLTMIPVGVQPNAIVVKAFRLGGGRRDAFSPKASSASR
jgi:YVTN family beta-propeller protein